MGTDPAFLFYSKDWLEGTAEYMPEEKGVYIDLLCYQQQRGGLPTDPRRLAKMVGLGIDEFTKIWDVISCNFNQMDDRLVNRKLETIMHERAEKGKINTITGTFAGLLRLGKFSNKEYKHLKANFKSSDFIQYPKEEITERLTEWLSLCLKSIEIGNEDINEPYFLLLKKVLQKNSIILPAGFNDIILEWLKYKSEKGQSYKETGLKNFILKFMKDCSSDIEQAKSMLAYSTSNNYTGLYKEKKNGFDQKSNSGSIKNVNAIWDRES